MNFVLPLYESSPPCYVSISEILLRASSVTNALEVLKVGEPLWKVRAKGKGHKFYKRTFQITPEDLKELQISYLGNNGQVPACVSGGKLERKKISLDDISEIRVGHGRYWW